MAFWSIAAPIIGSVIGAAGQRQAAKAQANAGKLDLGHLRAEAEAHGLNPLTVLQATGGAGSMTTAAAPGFLSFLAGQAPAIGSAIGQSLSPQTKADLDLTRTQADLNRQMVLESQQRPRDVNNLSGDREDDFMTEYLANPDGYTVMRTISGGQIKVRNDVLHRLELPPGALYNVAEDAEMLFAEVGSEGVGAYNAASEAGMQLNGGKPIHITVESSGPKKPDLISVTPLPPQGGWSDRKTTGKGGLSDRGVGDSGAFIDRAWEWLKENQARGGLSAN